MFQGHSCDALPAGLRTPATRTHFERDPRVHAHELGDCKDLFLKTLVMSSFWICPSPKQNMLMCRASCAWSANLQDAIDQPCMSELPQKAEIDRCELDSAARAVRKTTFLAPQRGAQSLRAQDICQWLSMVLCHIPRPEWLSKSSDELRSTSASSWRIK